MDVRNHVVMAKKHRKRRRFETNLPTPPPDPQEIEELEEALPILDNLPTPDYQELSSSRTTAALSVTDAFEHLSKLYGLVDQVLNLRDRNSKLFRRIRELEKIKALKKANSDLEKCLSNGQDIHVLDEDVGFAESLLGAMLSSGFDLPRRSSNISRATSSARRSGSLSTFVEQRRVSYPVTVEMPRRSSSRAVPASHTDKKRSSLVFNVQPKVSKWTRVKAAFKWEKAACNSSEVGEDALVKYLKIPDTAGVSSEISGPSTPAGTISSSSSVDDVFHKPHRPSSQSLKAGIRDEIPEYQASDPSRRSQSLDGEILSVPMNFNLVHSRIKDNFNTGKIDYRIHKTPWGKMKDIIQLRRDSLARQTSRRNEDNHSTSSLDSTDIHRLEDGRIPRVRITSDPSSSGASVAGLRKSSQNTEHIDLASRRLTPTLTITVPSSEELRNISSPESITPPPPRLISESGKSDRSSQGGEVSKERNGQMSPSSSSSGILRYGLGRSRSNQQSAKGDSLGSSPKMPRRDSKWNKVKRAFLTSATSVPTSPNKVSSYFFDDGETVGSYSAGASAEDLEDTSNPAAQVEIQRNYRLLYDKLGCEFYRKLAEWEKLKSSSTSPNPKESPGKHSTRDRDADTLRMLSEDQLTPQFRKKLDEWKRMGKNQMSTEPRSNSKRRITDWQLWRSHSKVEGKVDMPGRLSEDFVKKMEEWKRIKAAAKRDDDHDVKRLETEEEDNEEEENVKERGVNVEERERENYRLPKKFKTWKSLEDEEFKPLEKVLNAMENERQTRLSKLHRVVGSPENTQEILIHTSTGFFRFEGISRKFTRKLYEWEKSQGISPELSTFRLLDPLRYGISFNTRSSGANVQTERRTCKSLSRSKSVGSIRIESWNVRNDKSLARRPSSLSLNDMEHLEARSCIVASSVPTIADEEDTYEEVAFDDFDLEPELEPEAMIVDIEDVIEETASPLTKYQPHQTPVYSVAGSETTSIAIPLGTVTARHELSAVVLVEPDESQSTTCAIEEVIEDSFKVLDSEMEKSALGSEKINIESPGPSKSVIPNSTAGTEVNSKPNSSLFDEWKITQLNYSEDEDALTEVVITVACNSRQKRQGLKTRRLTDSQVGYKWQNNTSASNTSPNNHCVKNSTTPISSATTAPKTEDKNDFIETSNREKIKINESTLNKIVVPTSSGMITTADAPSDVSSSKDDPNQSEDHSNLKKEKRDPRNVLIKTKRIVFSPFKRESKGKSDEDSPVHEDQKDFYDNSSCTSNSIEHTIKQEVQEKRLSIPKSPIPARKEYKMSSPKETAPSIRMMIKKYNEKLENSSGFATGSTTSSGSNSPIWRSPVSERRIRDRLEKYQEEVRKAVAGPMYRRNILPNAPGISKSATVDFSSKPQTTEINELVNHIKKCDTSPQIVKNHISEPRNVNKVRDKKPSSTSLRALMLQKAKEDFLSGVTVNFSPNNDNNNINRVIRTKKEDNHQKKDQKKRRARPEDLQNLSRLDLVKSASVGMINVDLDTFEKLQLTARGCDSLPRSSEQWQQQVDKCNKESTSRFHQLANKFKRAKLRKSKEKDIGSMSTVSMLCRQSLLVDIAGTSKSCPTTPSPQYESEGIQKSIMRKSG